LDFRFEPINIKPLAAEWREISANHWLDVLFEGCPITLRIRKVTLWPIRHTGFDLLQAIKPVLNLMPSVPKPKRDIDLNRRLVYTVAALALYLVCTLTALYGVRKVAHQDPMYHLRLLTASSKFKLVELGLSPIVSSGMILQMLSGVGLITRNPSNALLDTAQKLAGLGMTAFQTGIAIFSGQYGARDEVGFWFVLHFPVVDGGGCCCDSPRRASSEWLWHRVGYFAFHCDEHLRADCLATVLVPFISLSPQDGA
jgi:hypothetical protein